MLCRQRRQSVLPLMLQLRTLQAVVVAVRAPLASFTLNRLHR